MIPSYNNGTSRSHFRPKYAVKMPVSILSQFCLMFAICLQKLGFMNSLHNNHDAFSTTKFRSLGHIRSILKPENVLQTIRDKFVLRSMVEWQLAILVASGTSTNLDPNKGSRGFNFWSYGLKSHFLRVLSHACQLPPPNSISKN